ncbi:MAG: hypothetical protein OHK0048_17560 [Rhodoferax sp.]
MHKILSLMLMLLIALPGAQARMLHGSGVFSAIDNIASSADLVSAGSDFFAQSTAPCHDGASRGAAPNPAQSKHDGPCPHGTCAGCATCALCHVNLGVPSDLGLTLQPHNAAPQSGRALPPPQHTQRPELRPPIAA